MTLRTAVARLVLAISAIVVFTHALAAGELRKITITSSALGGEEMPINVLLPDSYAGKADARYPVIFLLHGYGGNYTEWQRVGVVEEAKGLDVIIVMPEGDRSFYVNHHGKSDQSWEDYVTGEVVPHIDRSFRTVPTRQGRGISGLSMGGYGAMVLGLRHPELFGAIASHSGALGVPGPVGGEGIRRRLTEIFGPADSEERVKYDLVKLVERLPKAHRPDIYIDCGSADFLLSSNRAYVAELSKIGVNYEYREVPGQHDFAYWKRNVRYSLEHQLEALPMANELEIAKAAPEPKKDDAAPNASVAGDWDLTLVLENGREYEASLFVMKSAGGLEARTEWDSGSMKFPKAGIEGAKFSMESETIERDGLTGVARLTATVSERKMSGKWGLYGAGDTRLIGGTWSAKAKKLETDRVETKTEDL